MEGRGSGSLHPAVWLLQAKSRAEFGVHLCDVFGRALMPPVLTRRAVRRRFYLPCYCGTGPLGFSRGSNPPSAVSSWAAALWSSGRL